MHPSITGLVVVPLILLVFAVRRSRLEELLIWMVVFQGASVLNAAGGFAVGISPYFFTAALIAFVAGLKWASRKMHFLKGEFVRNHLQVTALFVVWCVASALLLPLLFERIPVDNPRAGTEAVFYQALPLKWSFSNLGQAGYMVLDFMVVFAFVDRSRDVVGLLNAFTYSGLTVVLVGLYQMACFRFGLPFPDNFFNSNAVWGQAYRRSGPDGRECRQLL